ncbi:hypothetical protein VYA_42600 (plasmid) [Vibrio alfacsensis]|nr:hypothetical protein VA249_42310 [Vibrio alfacsensis]BCN27068.1 hypothetical protein VYA_42600 [Vibrio alfacsensis]
MSINLGFGKVVDEITSNYLANLTVGRFYDPMKNLDAVWKKEIESKTDWDWGKRYDAEAFYWMAHGFADQLPDRWQESGFQVLKATDGKPLVQWRVFHDIGGIRCHSVIDAIVYNPLNDTVGPLDIKTTTAITAEDWMPHSEQLGFYANAIMDDPRIPYDKVTHGGFWEFMKRTPIIPNKPSKRKLIGPTIEPAKFFELNPSTLAELPARLQVTRNRINRREFIGQPRMAFNTPCTMCDFAEYCLKGDKSILQKRPKREHVIAQQPA